MQEVNVCLILNNLKKLSTVYTRPNSLYKIVFKSLKSNYSVFKVSRSRLEIYEEDFHNQHPGSTVEGQEDISLRELLQLQDTKL